MDTLHKIRSLVNLVYIVDLLTHSELNLYTSSTSGSIVREKY